MKINREELSWAAGFFDGEGHISSRRPTPLHPSPQEIQISIAQIDPRVLERFQNAVGGLGKIYGPFVSKQPNHRPKWTFQVHNFEHVQAIVAMLWAFLSPVKKEQARKALTEYKHMPRKWPQCIEQGHKVKDYGGRAGHTCLTCIADRKKLLKRGANGQYLPMTPKGGDAHVQN